MAGVSSCNRASEYDCTTASAHNFQAGVPSIFRRLTVTRILRPVHHRRQPTSATFTFYQAGKPIAPAHYARRGIAASRGKNIVKCDGSRMDKSRR